MTAGGWCVIFAEKGRKGRDLPMLPTFFIRSQGIRKLYCSLFTPLLERRGLTQLEMDILLFLANNPEYDTARDIVEKRHLAKSHVSVGVDALAGRGLLERQLREVLPPKESNNFCHRMVLFGRDTCTARSPKCEGCPLAKDCDASS